MSTDTTTPTTETNEPDGIATPEAPAAPAEKPQDAPQEPQEPEEKPSDDKPSSEAAKYRTRLRATEAERDELRAHVTELQGEVIRQLLVGKLADPRDFDQVGVAAVLGEDGRIDREKLDAAVTQLLEEKPHYAPAKVRPRTRPQPRDGVPAGQARAQSETKLQRAFPSTKRTRWSDVVGKGERGDATAAREDRVRLEVSRTQDQ